MMLYRTVLLSAFLCSAAAAAHAVDCVRLTQVKLDHGIVTAADTVAAGAPAASSSAAASSGASPHAAIPAAKIDYCRIQGTLKPSPDSDIRFELWVPQGGTWNGKFEQVGNGGFAGSLPYGHMAHVLSLGYAVAGTDDGHQARQMTDGSWALNHPQKIKDYGWRAIDLTTLAAKRVLFELTSKVPVKSYFVGCSDGGREALMMAQRFPAYFDGIIAGAPAYSMTRLLTGGALLSTAVSGQGKHLAAPQLALLQRHALQSCGNGAAYLEDPRECHPDLAALRCAAAATDDCLTEAQLDTARAIYAERKDPLLGSTLYAVLPGAEAVKGSWEVWLTGSDDGSPAAGMAFTWNYLAYMVMKDPHLDMAKNVSDADLERGEREIGPLIDSVNADLSAFKAHGGKLIQYHGWNDPGIPPGYSLEYRRRLAARTPGVQDFFRLYMVPGMLHCGGGDAPTSVDWQAALEAWVEGGVRPAELTASGGGGATQTLRPVE